VSDLYKGTLGIRGIYCRRNVLQDKFNMVRDGYKKMNFPIYMFEIKYKHLLTLTKHLLTLTYTY